MKIFSNFFIMQEINLDLLHFFNSLINEKFWFNFAYIFSDWPIFFLPIFLVFTWIFYSFKNIDLKENISRKKDLLFIFYSVVVAISANLIFQRFFHFDRPEKHCLVDGKTIIDHLPDASFPSDHATVSFAFLVSLYLAWYKKTFFVFAHFVVFMLCSRIMACVHWPFDIMTWAILWTIWAFVTFKFLKKIKLLDKLNDFILKISSKIKL